MNANEIKTSSFTAEKTAATYYGITQKIKRFLDDVAQKYGVDSASYTLERPNDDAHGDYATNISLSTYGALSSELKEAYPNPRSFAEVLARDIYEVLADKVASVDVAGPGFINLVLDETYLLKSFQKLADGSYRRELKSHYKNEKICIEYTDPNPFKEFHIGHLYSNTVGESIARIKEALGATVWRADYFGDVGMHAAKSVWGLIQYLEEHDLSSIDDLDNKPLSKRIEILGQCYALGATKYKESDEIQALIKDINYMLYVSAQRFLERTENWQPKVDYSQYISSTSSYNLELISHIFEVGRAWSLAYFDSIYQRVGVHFDGYYPESVVAEYGYELVQKHMGTVFETGDNGAIIYDGEKVGLHKRVFINSLGLPTYEAKELGLAPTKYADFAYTQSIIVTGNEINDYFNVLLAALNDVDPKLGKITSHIGHGMVRLPEGKMSSRTGKILRGAWLLDEARDSIMKVMDGKAHLSDSEKKSASEIVGQAAIKYAFLKQNIGGDIAFNFDTSLSFEGNSGPYLQYTYVRCKSVLERADTEAAKTFDINYTLNDAERSVVTWLLYYAEHVAISGDEHAPHIVCTYLHELAQRFNAFYTSHTILGVEGNVDDSAKNFRLTLTQCTADIMQAGLQLLGIVTPEKM